MEKEVGQNHHTPDLGVTIGRLRLKNPVLLASGTCGYGRELGDFLDLSRIGGIVVKGISLEPRPGNPPPRVIETPCGLLNAIGLENVGLERFIKEKLPWLKGQPTKVIVNILGNSVEEYEKMATALDEQPVDAIEVNISCPNVKEGGVAFGTSAKLAGEVTRAVRKATNLPVIVKLSPNVTDVTEIAKVVENEGADAISLINTILGMAIDIYRKRPVLGNVFGGLSGPAIKPVALRMVWQVARAVSIPVIGIGGISTWKDAVEYLMAGASAIQVGTATLIDPQASEQILNGLVDFMAKNNYLSLVELKIDK